MKKKILSCIIIAFMLFIVSMLSFEEGRSQLDLQDKKIQELVEAEEINQGFIKENDTEKEIKQQNITEQGDADDKVTINLHARSAALIDGKSGRVLYEKNGDKIVPMASTTKIMTCIITLENSNLDDIVTISSYASKMPDVQLNVKQGEQYKLKDLLYSLMLESHNDVAVAIAEHVGGSVEGFAAMMNAKARELGCVNTNFVTPNGLDADQHYTTAVELAKIASYAIKNKEFIEITNTPTWQFKDVTEKRSFTVTNKNRFLTMYEGAIGVKTGFTSKAGHCFVGAVVKDGRTFITSVLGSGWPPNRNFKWNDTKKLMDYGVENYNYKTIFKDIDKLKTILIRNGKEKTASTYVEGQLDMLVKEDDEIKLKYNVPEVLVAPVHKGNTIGYLNVIINGAVVNKAPIKISQSVEKIDFNYCINYMLDRFCITK